MKNSEYMVALCADTVEHYFIMLNFNRGRWWDPQTPAREIWQCSYEKVSKKHGFGGKDCEQWVQICESWFDCYLSNELSDD